MSSTIKKISTLIGLGFGAFALSAFAQVWNPAPANPPSNNVDAPINASATQQRKIGDLIVGLNSANTVTGRLWVGGLGILSSDFIFKPSSANVPVDSVLSAKDTSGTVEWKKSGFDFSDKGTLYSASVNTTKRSVTVGPAGAKAAALSFSKPGGSYCADFVFDVYDGLDTNLLLGRVWAGVAAGDIRNGVGGFMIVPTYNGTITLQRYSGDDNSCFVDITKVADIY